MTESDVERCEKPDPEVKPPTRRRQFTEAEKRRILAEADVCRERGDASRYTYAYTGTVRSTCATWRLDQDPALTAEVIGCTAWGCDRPGNDDQAEFFVWWMQNIPGPGNTNYDQDGRPMENWWAALFP